MKHIYHPSPEIAEKIRKTDFAKIVKDTLAAYSWCFDNHDDDNAISVNQLHKAVFGKRTRKEVDEVLTRLQRLHVLTAPELVPTVSSRHKREVRYLNQEWRLINVADFTIPGDVFTSLENALYGLIMKDLQPPVDTFEFKDVEAVRVLMDRNISFRGFPISLVAGTIIENDFELVQFLLRSGQPVAPANQVNTICCPGCYFKFDPTKTERPEIPPLICLANFRYSREEMIFEKTKGELVIDMHEIEFMINAKHPVDYAKDDEYFYCPNESCYPRIFKHVNDTESPARALHLQPKVEAPVTNVEAPAPVPDPVTVESNPVHTFGKEPERPPLEYDMSLSRLGAE